MFGFGIWEIMILVGLLVVLFGARRTGTILRQGMELRDSVTHARNQVRSLFSLDSLFGRRRDKDS